MSSQPPDSKTLESWEDAFQYPLPVVRKLEQQLRRNIDDNRQKLRSLVGASYRDLLGTAERIIDMDEQIHHVEAQMTDIGRRCNARNLEKMNGSHTRVRRDLGRGQNDRLRKIAQTKVLGNAVNVTQRVVRRGGDALVAAKVLILARLLHKGVAEADDPPTVLEDLQKKMTNARKKLLGYIARALSRTNLERSITINTLCAYALLSASAPQDVLRYFLQVRFEKLETMAEVATDSSVVEMLSLYSQTLSDAKDLFPRRFADALSQLTTNALVRDSEVRALHELSLDVYERWLPDDVRNFHPWVRHDELSSASVNGAMNSWGRQGQQCLLQTLQAALADEMDIHAVLRLRHKVISKYLGVSARLRQQNQDHALEDIRKACLHRLESLAVTAATVTNFALTAQVEGAETCILGTWDNPSTATDLGTLAFRKAVVKFHHGHTDSLDLPLATLDRWVTQIHEYADAVATMRATKWDDDVDLDLDDLMEDEPLQVMLGTRDPRDLEQKLRHAAGMTLQSIFATIEKSFESEAADPALLVRVVREVDERRGSLGDLVDGGENNKASTALIASLHQRMASQVMAEPVQSFTTMLQSPVTMAMTLWDGTPPLPVQPSPPAFRLLRSLHAAMSTFGKEVWSPTAVQTLKKCLSESLSERLSLSEIDQSLGMALSNGHDTTGESEGQSESAETSTTTTTTTNAPNASRARLVQHLFDVFYLQRVVHHPDGAGDQPLKRVAEALRVRIELELGVLERLKRNAHEYWRRTYLLFGLLATDGHAG